MCYKSRGQICQKSSGEFCIANLEIYKIRIRITFLVYHALEQFQFFVLFCFWLVCWFVLDKGSVKPKGPSCISVFLSKVLEKGMIKYLWIGLNSNMVRTHMLHMGSQPYTEPDLTLWFQLVTCMDFCHWSAEKTHVASVQYPLMLEFFKWDSYSGDFHELTTLTCFGTRKCSCKAVYNNAVCCLESFKGSQI